MVHTVYDFATLLSSDCENPRLNSGGFLWQMNKHVSAEPLLCRRLSVFYLVNGHKSCLHYQSVGFTGERLEVTLQHGPAFFSQHALQSDFNIYEKVKQERVTRTNTFTQLNHVSRF